MQKLVNPQSTHWNKRYRTGDTPWDTDSPCTELQKRLADMPSRSGTALEIGCGTGNNSILLAQCGFEVTAVDISDVAITLAKERANRKNIHVEFRVADICGIEPGYGVFDLIIDRGCYHYTRLFNFNNYIAGLEKISRPGSFLITLAGNDEEGRKWGPPRVSLLELINDFSTSFSLIEVRTFHFDDIERHPGPLGWSALWMRRKQPRLCQRISRPDSRGINELTTSAAVPEAFELEYRVQAILNRFSWAPCSPWRIQLTAVATTPSVADLKISFLAKDRETGEQKPVNYVRGNAYSASLSEREIIEVTIANLAVIGVHEMLESTLIDGQRQFDPHELYRFLDSRYAEALTVLKTGK